MKIFDYFKRLKERNFEGKERDKPKNDKAFLAIIIVYIFIIAINCIAGIFDFNNIFSRENAVVDFKISPILFLTSRESGAADDRQGEKNIGGA